MLLIPATLNAAIITDDVGRKVDIDTPVESVVCLSPAHTEMIYYLGCQAALKAVSSSCDYPKEAKKLQKAGSFLNPDIEAIVKIKPGLVISGGGIQKKAIAAMEKLGIKVLVMYPRNIDGITKDMKIIAEVLGCGNGAQKAKQFGLRSKRPVKTPAIRVYAELWNSPAMGAGGQSFINGVIEDAGGVNILKDALSEFPKVSAEEIIKRQPEVIILLYQPEKGFKDREHFKMTPAGKAGRIYFLKQEELDSVLRPGPRIKAGTRIFEKLIDAARKK